MHSAHVYKAVESRKEPARTEVRQPEQDPPRRLVHPALTNDLVRSLPSLRALAVTSETANLGGLEFVATSSQLPATLEELTIVATNATVQPSDLHRLHRLRVQMRAESLSDTDRAELDRLIELPPGYLVAHEARSLSCGGTEQRLIVDQSIALDVAGARQDRIMTMAPHRPEASSTLVAAQVQLLSTDTVHTCVATSSQDCCTFAE